MFPPENIDENASQLIYAACFNIEKKALELRKKDSALYDFIDQDGYKILNIIFDNTVSHVNEKSKDDGIFYGVNEKYTIPGEDETSNLIYLFFLFFKINLIFKYSVSIKPIIQLKATLILV